MSDDGDVADWSEFCRGCLSRTPLVGIFEENDDIKTKFFESTTIMAAEGDGLPAYLCLDCLDTLNHAHQFKNECLRIDRELKERLREMKEEAAQKQAEKKKKKKKEKKFDPMNIKLEDLSDDQGMDEDCYYVVVINQGKDGTQSVKAIKMEDPDDPPVQEDIQEEVPLNIKTEQVQSLENEENDYAEDDANDQQFGEEDQQINDEVVEGMVDVTFGEELPIEETLVEEHIIVNSNTLNMVDGVLEEPGEPSEEDKLNFIQVLAENGDMVDDDNIIRYADDTVALVGDVFSGEVAFGEDGVAYTQEEVVVSNGDEGFEILNADGAEFVIDYEDDEDTITVYQQEDGSFLCDCGKSFMEFLDYEKHKWSHNSFTCPICSKGFESAEIVKGHLMLHTSSDAHLICPFCKLLVKRNQLVSHIKMNHSNYKPCCTICNKSFVNETNLKRHTLIHLGVRQYECDICHKFFSQKISMQNHRLTHRDMNEVKCETCNAKFTTQDTLNSHLEQGCEGSMDKDGKFVCSACGKEYSSSSSLKSHMEFMHNTQRVELLCSECGEVLPTRKAMYSHSYTHRQSRTKHLKRFSCGICGKGCASHAMLLMHERVHTNERPFKCSHCTLAFKTKTHLTTHQLTHTQEKRFGCSICMKFFALKGNLVVHLRTHTGERPYICSICNQAFIDSKYLKKHKLRRHDIGNTHWNKYY